MATPPTTNGVVDQTTSDSPPSVEQPNDNIGLIIGVVVVLILIMAIIALAIIAAGCFLRTRMSRKRLSAPGSPTAVTNPNYDSSKRSLIVITCGSYFGIVLILVHFIGTWNHSFIHRNNSVYPYRRMFVNLCAYSLNC